ncbi:hypothetical protein L226DRAFT_517130 [Lentinus tigrinus ALCF2SS1-7]|uniref:Uncharacterized protein n=1 Tax=Lentinus tigrinus ALCF2SS1-6 TaxID=1328759 RepID=A0A5C2RT13_9APHY|nr:hypothetical protein L227DRAFT_658299 [Lentinus tigrinus ALCF2SS1-6]RPD68483.1 hypothetical protein L226DRAFT_517130 [Lentinus tigrinus ALCF2SS1-7]
MQAARVNTLLDLIASHDDDYQDPNFHRAVYDHIKGQVNPVVPSSSCPPFPVLAYAVRNILEPSFLIQEIPNLLRLIVHLELLRQHIVGTMQRIIRHSDDPRMPISLDSDHYRVLTQLIGPKRLAAQRTVYRKIVNGCCLLHIHHLWRIYNPEKDPPLTTSLINYFPTFVQRDPDLRDECCASRKTHPWHYAISEDELAANCETGQRAAGFMFGASQYLDDPAEYCSNHGFDPDTPFDDIFPPPDSLQIVEAIKRYIKMVKNAVDALEHVLEGHSGSTG